MNVEECQGMTICVKDWQWVSRNVNGCQEMTKHEKGCQEMTRAFTFATKYAQIWACLG